MELKTKISQEKPDDIMAKVKEELRFIVKTNDLRGLEDWIERYIRRVGVTYPVVPTADPRLDPLRVAHVRIAGNLGVALAPACVWAEKLEVDKAQKHVSAELYFLDILGVMKLEKGPNA